MEQYRPPRYALLPEITKHLLIINALAFFGTWVLESRLNIDVIRHFALYPFSSPLFRPHQLITHMFLHGNFTHIFFNMFALWMFGGVVERVLGARRYLLYYLLTGIGAAILHLLVQELQIRPLLTTLSNTLNSSPFEILASLPDQARTAAYQLVHLGAPSDAAVRLVRSLFTPTVGASGAVFGLLLAFGWMFPNSYVYIYFFFPMKAKYFVIFYGILELWLGIQGNVLDNVAHFAHVGGMLFGIILLKIWKFRKIM